MDSNLVEKRKADILLPEEVVRKNPQKDSTVDGIEIIVEMAKTGKIDPWNLDIVDVTDKYLQKLVEIKANDLKLTGRTLFFAAVLLRLKSDILEGISPFDEEPLEEDFFDDYDDHYEEDIENINVNNVISIDEVLERRTSTRLNRGRVVTLKDLIKQLEFYEKIDKKLALKNQQVRTQKRSKSYENYTAQDIINMAHDEYIETSVAKLQNVLEKLFDAEKQAKVELSELTSTGMDKVSIYIALLFLSARSDIDLVQDEFYSDLYITNQTQQVESEL